MSQAVLHASPARPQSTTRFSCRSARSRFMYQSIRCSHIPPVTLYALQFVSRIARRRGHDRVAGCFPRVLGPCGRSVQCRLRHDGFSNVCWAGGHRATFGPEAGAVRGHYLNAGVCRRFLCFCFFVAVGQRNEVPPRTVANDTKQENPTYNSLRLKQNRPTLNSLRPKRNRPNPKRERPTLTKQENPTYNSLRLKQNRPTLNSLRLKRNRPNPKREQPTLTKQETPTYNSLRLKQNRPTSDSLRPKQNHPSPERQQLTLIKQENPRLNSLKTRAEAPPTPSASGTP